MSEAVIRERYEAAGQGHVLDFVVDLEDSEKQALLTQLDEIPVELLDGYLKAAMAETSSSTSIDDISPFVGSVGRTTDTKLVEDSYGVGMGAIRRGRLRLSFWRAVKEHASDTTDQRGCIILVYPAVSRCSS